ncbi:TPA: hypothetical protein ENX78_09180 [Candidatus Poribacteria bacterium]|nr:hypothetical protein [Candidatus Poribacteria bacterium]
MKYDIAAKAILDISKEHIIREFLGLDDKYIHYLDDLPEETVSIRRSDFPLRVTLKDGKEIIVLIEIQTEFNNDFVLRLIDYTVRFMLRYHLRVIPLVLLLTPSQSATGVYEDDRIKFRYEIVRFWEKKAEDYLNNIYLLPFLPLMDGGDKIIEQAEKIIYESVDIEIRHKADLLTAMAIFAGLRDRNLGVWLAERRRDIMIKSPVYEFIKEEGMKEGMKEGIQQGMQKLLVDTLEIKFEIIPKTLINSINEVTDSETLRILHNIAVKCNSIEEFVEKMKLVIEH